MTLFPMRPYRHRRMRVSSFPVQRLSSVSCRQTPVPTTNRMRVSVVCRFPSVVEGTDAKRPVSIDEKVMCRSVGRRWK